MAGSQAAAKAGPASEPSRSALVPATAASVMTAPDPVVGQLEAFLAAIQSARGSARSAR
jgi:hypothetical protein